MRGRKRKRGHSAAALAKKDTKRPKKGRRLDDLRGQGNTDSTASEEREDSDATTSSKSRRSSRGKHKRNLASKLSTSNSKNETSVSSDETVKPSLVEPGNPFGRPGVATLKKTGESFLQDKPCVEEAPRLPKCLECKAGAECKPASTKSPETEPVSNIFCRFYAFRRLRYGKNGQLTVAGFCDPYRDFGDTHSALWKASAVKRAVSEKERERAHYILKNLAKDFELIVKQERMAARLHCGEGKSISQDLQLLNLKHFGREMTKI